MALGCHPARRLATAARADWQSARSLASCPTSPPLAGESGCPTAFSNPGTSLKLIPCVGDIPDDKLSKALYLFIRIVLLYRLERRHGGAFRWLVVLRPETQFPRGSGIGGLQ